MANQKNEDDGAFSDGPASAPCQSIPHVSIAMETLRCIKVQIG